jgi:hypothetical protein
MRTWVFQVKPNYLDSAAQVVLTGGLELLDRRVRISGVPARAADDTLRQNPALVLLVPRPLGQSEVEHVVEVDVAGNPCRQKLGSRQLGAARA